MTSLRERAAMALTGRSPEVVELADKLTTAVNNGELLAENLQQLELAIKGDDEWKRMGMAMRQEFSRAGLDDIMDVSRAMYLVNPLIQRAVNVTTYYTWAQGWQYRAKEDRIYQEVVEQTITVEENRLELYSHQARILTDIDQIVDGNVAFACFTDGEGNVQLRSIPTEQLREIITNPQDRIQVRFYRRQWTQVEFNERTGTYEHKAYERLHPDIHYHPRVKRESIGGIDVAWDAPIIHQRTGGLKQMQFGIPQTYAALDWARAYKKFLEDWHTVVSSLARFAWKASTKGSKADKLKDRLRRRGVAELGENPADSDTGPPVAGAMWADTADLTPINKSGTVTQASDSKQSRLMVGAAMDLPDTILSGDPQQGNLATATTLDRPTELAMRNRQSMANDFDARLFRYVVDAKVRRGRLPGRVVRTPEGSVVEPGIDPTVATVFPPILEHEPDKIVDAIVTAATLDGKVDAFTMPREELSKLLMNAVGTEDIDQAMQDLEAQGASAVAAAVDQINQQLAAANAAAGQNGNGGPPDDGEEEE